MGKAACSKGFSAFKRKVISEYMDEVRPLVPPPQPQSSLAETAALPPPHDARLGAEGSSAGRTWRAGEDEAHDRLNPFTRNRVRVCGERDLPAREGTSTLSPYLAIGALSVRQCWQAVICQSQRRACSRRGIQGGDLDERVAVAGVHRHLCSFIRSCARVRRLSLKPKPSPWFDA